MYRASGFRGARYRIFPHWQPPLWHSSGFQVYLTWALTPLLSDARDEHNPRNGRWSVTRPFERLVRRRSHYHQCLGLRRLPITCSLGSVPTSVSSRQKLVTSSRQQYRQLHLASHLRSRPHETARRPPRRPAWTRYDE